MKGTYSLRVLTCKRYLLVKGNYLWTVLVKGTYLLKILVKDTYLWKVLTHERYLLVKGTYSWKALNLLKIHICKKVLTRERYLLVKGIYSWNWCEMIPGISFMSCQFPIRSRCILSLWHSFLWITVSSFLKIYYLFVTWWWPGDRGWNMLSPCHLK